MDWGAICFALFCVGLVSGGFFLMHRENKLVHLERMAAIEKGMLPASLDERPLRVYFRRGLLWLIPGVGLTIFLWFVSGDFSGAWSAAGVLMTCIGLAYLLYYFVEGRRQGVS
jgi:hypothetical protein